MADELSRFERLCVRSQGLHGNKNVLPVALAVIETGQSTVKAPEIGMQLGGRIAGNRVLEALERLCALGAMFEHPYAGRPAPRFFERIDSAYWDFVPLTADEAYATETPARRF